jgi:hypothetical protein
VVGCVAIYLLGEQAMFRAAVVDRCFAAVAFLVLAHPGSSAEPDRPLLQLIRAGEPEGALIAPEEKSPIWDLAVTTISSTVKRWGGTAPRVVRLARGAPLPAGDLILLGTPESSDAIAALTRQIGGPIAQVPFADRHGFAVDARRQAGANRLVIAGRTPRGVFNGAVFCRDFLLDAGAVSSGKPDVFAHAASLVRSPKLGVRGIYLLSLYGVAMKYTARDWMKVIDRFTEDGIERVCFWLSGHHPSARYPRLYNVDATANTRLTVDGVRQLIRYCHDRDIKFYIGGGVFAWTAAHYLVEGHPEIAAVVAGGLCPSKPLARTGNREHFLEMYETWPDADGFMCEIRDEHGQCQCGQCQVRLDDFGSKAYGRSEITWLQEFAREAWRRNPRLHFCWLIGYTEHARDVAYYNQIREMSDPRFEWLDVRVGLDLGGAWQLPGPRGVGHPFAFFSRRIAHFDPFYKVPIANVLTAAQRSADLGLSGYVPAFEPGFSSASYYQDQIPLPTDFLPYCLTGFVYREATWEPGLTLDQLKEQIRRRYFSPGAPKRLADDMIFLRQFSIDYAELLAAYAGPRHGYDGRELERLTVEGERARIRSIADQVERRQATQRLRAMLAKLAEIPAALDRMKEIEAALVATERDATPKTREGSALLRRMIEDTRAIYQQAVPDPKALLLPVE